MYAGNGFRSQCEHWRRKHFLQSASRPEIRRISGSRRNPTRQNIRQEILPPFALKDAQADFSTIHSFPATCAPGTVSVASAHTGGGNISSSQRTAQKSEGFQARAETPRGKISVRRFCRHRAERRASGFQHNPLVPGDMCAGNGFRSQCAHWRRKHFLRSGSRPEPRRGSGFRSSPSGEKRAAGFAAIALKDAQADFSAVTLCILSSPSAHRRWAPDSRCTRRWCPRRRSPFHRPGCRKAGRSPCRRKRR